MTAPAVPDCRTLVTEGFPDYALVDAGDGRKLERFGTVLLDRPEPQAFWPRTLPAERWAAAHAVFDAPEDAEGGRWALGRPVPDGWPVRWGGVTVTARLTSFRHVGVFPDQDPHWTWIEARVRDRVTASGAGAPPRLLNLFAYTGMASLVAARAGALVTHLDASKKALDWARENQAASGLPPDGIRWILDDALKFTAREVRRGARYDGIVVDPPKFGRGPKTEVWDVFRDLRPLMEDCAALLNPGPSFLVLTVYALRASWLSVDHLVRRVFAERPGTVTSGELCVRSAETGAIVPTSLYARWQGARLQGDAP